MTETRRFPDFEESPTVLVVREPRPDAIVRLATLERDGDAGIGPSQTLDVLVDVFDANVTQGLEWRFFLSNGAAVDPPAECPGGVRDLRACGTLPGCTGACGESAQLRDVRLAIPIADFGLGPRCARMELRVAEDFDGITASGPVARAIWWVDVTDDPNESATLRDCPDPLR